MRNKCILAKINNINDEFFFYISYANYYNSYFKKLKNLILDYSKNNNYI